MNREASGFGIEMTETKKIIAQELKTEEELVQYFLVLIKNDPNITASEDKVPLLAQIMAKQNLQLSKLNNNAPHFFGAYEGDKMVGIGRLYIDQDKNKNKFGFLSGLVVESEYRGKDASKFLTDARMQCAQANGCEYVQTDVVVDNPTGLLTKFKDGFILTDCKGGEGLFFLSKKINALEDFDRHSGPVGELKQIPLGDTSAIEIALKQSWAGIDIKNIGNPKDASPENWILILEKSTT
ncbi:MAG: GNAT family N-acetyltransferase [Candidatus Magasanikbacteria bacterium]|nr:GNAT family N-acetyltransferase [Candidatus Magasanikbacteria bacterium]